jgi:hypothetical protein
MAAAGCRADDAAPRRNPEEDTMIVMRTAVAPLNPSPIRRCAEPLAAGRSRKTHADEPFRDDEAAPSAPLAWLELSIARFHNGLKASRPRPNRSGLGAAQTSESQPSTTGTPGSGDVAEPERADEPARDESIQSWYDSSYELRRGLLVIELELDPRLTHGVLVAAL